MQDENGADGVNGSERSLGQTKEEYEAEIKASRKLARESARIARERALNAKLDRAFVSGFVAAERATSRNRPGFLLVATNPWAAIDHKGRPSGACPAEVGPRDENARSYVGARPAFGDVTRPAPRRAELYQRTERRDLVWEFQREPFEVPDTSYYRRKVRERELLDATKDYEAARALLSARHKDAAPPRWI